MGFPKLTVPHYDVTCPSGQRVSFRPFLVKEEKLLLIAMQSGDTATIIKTTKNILENCIGSVSNVNIDKLPLFDIEFLLLQLRARSIGEVVPLRYKCNGKIADANGELVACHAISEYTVNLLDIKPVFGEGHSKYIQLTDAVGVTLKYPTFTSFQSLTRKELPPDESFQFLVECIESVNDAQTVVYAKDVEPQEIIDWINTLGHEHVEKMDQFFTTMPKISTVIHFKCPKCTASEDITVQGLESFFV